MSCRVVSCWISSFTWSRASWVPRQSDITTALCHEWPLSSSRCPLADAHHVEPPMVVQIITLRVAGVGGGGCQTSGTGWDNKLVVVGNSHKLRLHSCCSSSKAPRLQSWWLLSYERKPYMDSSRVQPTPLEFRRPSNPIRSSAVLYFCETFWASKLK